MNSTFDIIRFSFNEPIHISNARSDYARSEDIIRSDTLSAAVMQSWALLGKDDWINNSPGFVTSSLFPYGFVDGECVYFLPKPVKDQPENQLTPGMLKKFKKVRYYEKSFFERRLTGLLEIIDEDISDDILTRKLKSGTSSLYRSSVIPRIMRPRDSFSDTRIFYMERKSFEPGAGLFCIVKYGSDEAKSRFLAGLKLLADNGLGSDRTVGHGRFTFAEDQISFSLPENFDCMISLSLYLPDSAADLAKEIGPATRYDLLRRGGWISEPFNTLRKRTVYMFSEGSIFMFKNEPDFIKGRIADVKPLTMKTYHAIYRSGESIFLPIKSS